MGIPAIDQTLGMKVYASKTLGIGGVIRDSIEDFRVEEVLADGSVASIEEQEDNNALGATAHQQRYLLCVLIKRGWDNLSAVLRIAKELGISQRQIQIAGIKDARAVTAQHITIEGVSAEEISGIRIRDVEVRPLGYFRDGLAPFYLLGNKFRVRVKGISHREANTSRIIGETICALESSGGIPNFFGHQRFGTKRPITHIVGKAIAKGNFEEAAMLFLTQTSDYEHPESRQARADLRSNQNFKQALEDFPRQLRYERAMLGHLAEEPKDFIGAFQRLPPKLQELFVQAYQSYLFNLFLSERLKAGFSLNKAEPGDIVINVDHSGLPMSRTGKAASAESLADINNLVRVGKMRVALPLIGLKQKPSEGVMGEIQREILEAEGVETKGFRVSGLKIMSRKGELRAVVSPVKKFEFQNTASKEDSSSAREVELSLMLLRGSYATMFLREIMKPEDPVSSGF